MLLPLQVLAEWIALHITGMGPLDPWMLKMRVLVIALMEGFKCCFFRTEVKFTPI